MKNSQNIQCNLERKVKKFLELTIHYLKRWRNVKIVTQKSLTFHQFIKSFQISRFSGFSIFLSLKAYNLLFELIKIELQKLVYFKMSLYTRVLKLGAVKAHRGRERCFEFKSLILFFLKQKWQFSHSLKAKSVTFSPKKKVSETT